MKYKVGYSKEFNGKIFYFCDCPLHCNRLKWHTHTVDKCRTRIRWLQKNEGDDNKSTTNGDDTANLGTTNDSPLDPIIDTEASPSPPLPSQDVQALLASALNICGDNDILRD